MEFRHKVSTEDISKYSLQGFKIRKETEWWWITVNDFDLLHNIHIYVDRKRWRRPKGWHQISSETCLGIFAKILLDLDFKSKFLQSNLSKIKEISENFDYNKLFQTPWAYIANSSAGPFTIIDGVHRQLGTYIYYFIKNQNQHFKPVEYALCAIPTNKDESFGRFPKEFC